MIQVNMMMLCFQQEVCFYLFRARGKREESGLRIFWRGSSSIWKVWISLPTIRRSSKKCMKMY